MQWNNNDNKNSPPWRMRHTMRAGSGGEEGHQVSSLRVEITHSSRDELQARFKRRRDEAFK